MTLDEAIKQEQEKAKINNDCANKSIIKHTKSIYTEFIKQEDNHKQLAEWLKELKQLREQTYGDLISRQEVLDSLYALCDTGESLKENPWRDNPHIDALTETIEQIPSANQSDRIITELEKITERINEIKGDNKYVVSDYMYGLYKAFGIVDDIIADRIAELKGEPE